jgi:hypothetical protein
LTLLRQSGWFELDRDAPPMVRMVVAMPLLSAGAETDWAKFHEGPGARPVFAIGNDFVAANDRRTMWLITLARWTCIPLSVIGGIVCYLWSGRLYGRGPGLLSLALWCFSPHILAHAALITRDLRATALGTVAACLLWCWLRSPTWPRALVAGFALRLAELTEASWIILFGLRPVALLIRRLSRLPTAAGQTFGYLRHGCQLLLVLTVTLHVRNMGYGSDGTLARFGDLEFGSSRAFAGSPGNDPAAASGHPPVNRFAEAPLGAILVPLPKNYALRIDAQRRDLQRFCRPSYLRGVFRDQGRWHYYLCALAIKAPLVLPQFMWAWEGYDLFVFVAVLVRLVRKPLVCRLSFLLEPTGTGIPNSEGEAYPMVAMAENPLLRPNRPTGTITFSAC